MGIGDWHQPAKINYPNDNHSKNVANRNEIIKKKDLGPKKQVNISYQKDKITNNLEKHNKDDGNKTSLEKTKNLKCDKNNISQKEEKFVKSYEIIKFINDLKKAKIYMVQKNGKVYKLVGFKILSKNEDNEIIKDIKNLINVFDKFIIPIQEYFIENSEKYGKMLYFVLDNKYSYKSLAELLYGSSEINSSLIWKILIQIVIILHRLNNNNIDISELVLDTKNIYIDEDNNIKIDILDVFDFFNLYYDNKDDLDLLKKYFIEKGNKDTILVLGHLLYELIFRKKFYKDENVLNSCEDKDLKIILTKILGNKREIYSLNDILSERVFILKIIEKMDLFMKPNLEGKFTLLILFYFKRF